MRIKSFCFVFRAVQCPGHRPVRTSTQFSCAPRTRARLCPDVRAQGEGGLGNCHRHSAITEQWKISLPSSNIKQICFEKQFSCNLVSESVFGNVITGIAFHPIQIIPAHSANLKTSLSGTEKFHPTQLMHSAHLHPVVAMQYQRKSLLKDGPWAWASYFMRR